MSTSKDSTELKPLTKPPTNPPPPSTATTTQTARTDRPTTTSPSRSPGPLKSHTLPTLPVNLYAHKLALILVFLPIFITACILPLTGWFAIRYHTTFNPTYILSIITPIFGAVSLFALITRTIRLSKRGSTCRPLANGPSRWELDYFGWNFIGGFIVVCGVIAAGIALHPSNLRLVSMPLPLLLVQVCGQQLLLSIFVAAGVIRRAPFSYSSTRKGDPIRPAGFVIAEDVVAVDGKQDSSFRQIWMDRYEASPPMRKLLKRLDWMWGASGCCVAIACLVVIWAVNNADIGWAISWSVPWVWALGMFLITIKMAKGMLREEERFLREGKIGV